MATQIHSFDFQDTLAQAEPPSTVAPRRLRPPVVPGPAWLSPRQVVTVVGLVALVVFLLACIAGVAKAQVRKGSEFQFAAQWPVVTAEAKVYSSRGGTHVADLGPVAALSN